AVRAQRAERVPGRRAVDGHERRARAAARQPHAELLRRRQPQRAAGGQGQAHRRPEPLVPRRPVLVVPERGAAALPALRDRLLVREARAVMVAVTLRPGWGTRLAAFAAAVLLSGLGGCDYFRPGKPELSKVGAVIVPNYRQEDSTLAYLARGIEDKGRTNGLSVFFGGQTQTIAHGFARLYFIKVSSKWVIVRWDDREADNADLAAGEICLGQRRVEP